MTLFSFIHDGEVHLTTDDKVIPSEDFSTLLDAIKVLEKAREDAEHYKKQVQAECETLKEKAHEKGFAEGLERFNGHLIHFDKQLRTIRAELQRQILALALKAAKKIVGEQLNVSPETIVEIVIQTLTPVIQNQRFNIFVNKADKDTLEAQKPKIKQILDHVQTLTIHERSDVEPGGCIIETESGIINASLENQWRALESAFDKYMQT